MPCSTAQDQPIEPLLRSRRFEPFLLTETFDFVWIAVYVIDFVVNLVVDVDVLDFIVDVVIDVVDYRCPPPVANSMSAKGSVWWPRPCVRPSGRGTVPRPSL